MSQLFLQSKPGAGGDEEESEYEEQEDCYRKEMVAIGRAVLKERRSWRTLMTPTIAENLTGLLSEYDFDQEAHVILCCALYASLQNYSTEGYLEPITARAMLEAVYGDAALETKLPVIWMLTLNRFLLQVRPDDNKREAQGNHTALDDRYVASEQFILYVDRCYGENGRTFDYVPLKDRTVYPSQAGYDAERRVPTRIEQPGDQLTKREWEAIMHELDAYNLDQVAILRDGIECIHKAYLRHGTIDETMIDTIKSTPVYRYCIVHDSVQPFRIFMIMQTIRYNIYFRSYPGWYFTRPDDDPNVMRFPDISLN